jgi:hypothetical protein
VAATELGENLPLTNIEGKFWENLTRKIKNFGASGLHGGWY